METIGLLRCGTTTEAQLVWAMARARGGGPAGDRAAGAGVSHHPYFDMSLGAVFGPLMHQAPSAAW